MTNGPETGCTWLLFLIKHGAVLGEVTGYFIKQNTRSLQWLTHTESHSHWRANVENGRYEGGGIWECRNGVKEKESLSPMARQNTSDCHHLRTHVGWFSQSERWATPNHSSGEDWLSTVQEAPWSSPWLHLLFSESVCPFERANTAMGEMSHSLQLASRTTWEGKRKCRPKTHQVWLELFLPKTAGKNPQGSPNSQRCRSNHFSPHLFTHQFCLLFVRSNFTHSCATLCAVLLLKS